MIDKTVRGLLFFSGALLMVYGIMRGEAVKVFLKAVNICLECIGVG